MKLSFTKIAWAFITSLFTGIVVLSVGLGAAFPVIHRVADPFLCANGKMETEQQHYSYQPGQSTTTLTWLCIDDRTGEEQDISFQTALTAGVIYGLLFFVVYIVYTLVGPFLGIKNNPAPPKRAANGPYIQARLDTVSNTRQRLEALKSLYESNLISEGEYEEKKRQILEEL